MKMSDWLRNRHHHPDQPQSPQVDIKIGEVIINIEEDGGKPRIGPKLAFVLLINNPNFNSMVVITSLNLTSTAPVELSMTVVDQNGNQIAGVISGLSYVAADPTQDVAVADPTTATDVDIHAVSLTGGTNVIATASFVSTAVNTNPDGSTTPVLSGSFTSDPLTITNNVVIPPTLTGKLVFNQ